MLQVCAISIVTAHQLGISYLSVNIGITYF